MIVNNILRGALWSSYNYKCFYCTQPLEWEEIQIDHIIPESLSKKPDIFFNLLFEYGLENEFDLNSLVNLVPTHGKCNNRKADEIFEKSTVLYYLQLTKKCIANIEAEMNRIKSRRDKGQLMSRLHSAIESNLISTYELNNILQQVKQEQWDISSIKLSDGIEFIDEVYDKFYLNSDYKPLYDKELLFIKYGYGKYLELVNDSGKKIRVNTINERQRAYEKGFYAVGHYNLNMDQYFIFIEGFLDSLKIAKMPKISFISEPWIGVNTLELLSPKIMNDVEGKLKKYLRKGYSVADLINEGKIKINLDTSYDVSLIFDGMQTSLTEIFRADFNNDGIEDMFVKGNYNAVGGTYTYGFTAVLSRLSEKHFIE